MKLEVANKCNPTTYWVASVVMTCGPLLRLRYDGYGEDSAADFWSDVFTSDIHPIGWCAQNSKNLQPPEGNMTVVYGLSSDVDLAIYVTGLITSVCVCMHGTPLMLLKKL